MTRFALTKHPNGVAAAPGNRVVYDIGANTAYFGEARVVGPALVFELTDTPSDSALLSVEIDLDVTQPWLLRCDRVDFPPGGIAYLHTHPGPGIRCQLFGELTVVSGGKDETYGPLKPWFESGPDPVYAEASKKSAAAFVRVLVLPPEWEGKRTIRYVNPEDEARPKLQKATVFFEEKVTLA